MTVKQEKLLKKILRCTQNQLRGSLAKTLKYHYKNVVNHYDYIYAEGDIPICLVAHMDTVHKAIPAEIYYDRKNEVMWSPQGIGGDDRAGIYAILKIIKDGFRPHVVFTSDEEIGCIGASFLAKDYPECPFSECHFLIELDRRGHTDSVYYEYDENADGFANFINKYGFKTEFGTYSDICEIAPHWDMAAVNLSIGYEREHTLLEVVHIDWMYDTIRKVENILKDARDGLTHRYEFVYSQYAQYGFYGSFRDYANDGVYDVQLYKDAKNNKKDMCYWCLQFFDKKDLIEIKAKDGYIDCYCKDCYNKAMKIREKETRVDV